MTDSKIKRGNESWFSLDAQRTHFPTFDELLGLTQNQLNMSDVQPGRNLKKWVGKHKHTDHNYATIDKYCVYSIFSILSAKFMGTFLTLGTVKTLGTGKTWNSRIIIELEKS